MKKDSERILKISGILNEVGGRDQALENDLYKAKSHLLTIVSKMAKSGIMSKSDMSKYAKKVEDLIKELDDLFYDLDEAKVVHENVFKKR